MTATETAADLLGQAQEALARERARAETAEAELAAAEAEVTRLRAILGERDGEDRLITPAEACRILRVSRKTLIRWSDAGKPAAVRTSGRHRRFREPEVRALLLPGDGGDGT